MLLYQKPWFGRGECITYADDFDVVAAIRRREAWSEKQKIERLKEYHADLNARTSDYAHGVIQKWNGLLRPEEPNPRMQTDAAVNGDGDEESQE